MAKIKKYKHEHYALA